jgi:hypothetical protein
MLGDMETIQNALSMNWSNGQVKGQVNKLKTQNYKTSDVWEGEFRIAPQTTCLSKRLGLIFHFIRYIRCFNPIECVQLKTERPNVRYRYNN